MYKVIILSVMFVFSFAKDSGASGSPWDPRAGKGEGMSESAIDDQFPSDKAEETTHSHIDESEE